MYIGGLIPRNFAELAEAVPIDKEVSKFNKNMYLYFKCKTFTCTCLYRLFFDRVQGIIGTSYLLNLSLCLGTTTSLTNTAISIDGMTVNIKVPYSGIWSNLSTER